MSSSTPLRRRSSTEKTCAASLGVSPIAAHTRQKHLSELNPIDRRDKPKTLCPNSARTDRVGLRSQSENRLLPHRRSAAARLKITPDKPIGQAGWSFSRLRTRSSLSRQPINSCNVPSDRQSDGPRRMFTRTAARLSLGDSLPVVRQLRAGSRAIFIPSDSEDGASSDCQLISVETPIRKKRGWPKGKLRRRSSANVEVMISTFLFLQTLQLASCHLLTFKITHIETFYSY